MNILVSIGEIYDKISILKIKESKIKDINKLNEIRKEIKTIDFNIKYQYYFDLLLEVNTKIWDLTDQVKLEPNLEKYQLIFKLNDDRFRIKNKINNAENSFLKEQKNFNQKIVILDYFLPEEEVRKNSLNNDIIYLPNNTSELYRQIYSNDPSIKYIKNYLVGGKLGDTLHLLYVIKEKEYKANLYISDDTQYGGDFFTFGLENTFNDLKPVINSLSYINKFEIYDKQTHIDVNLNNFRKHPCLFCKNWIELLSETFYFSPIYSPWLQIEDNNRIENKINDEFKDVILIHRPCLFQHRKINEFTNFLENIITKNNCLFIGFSQEEYDKFELKHLIKFRKTTSLLELYNAIKSCKFFIDGQSSPLVLAFGIQKPLLCEAPEGHFYLNKFYSEFFNFPNYLIGIEKYINI